MHSRKWVCALQELRISQLVKMVCICLGNTSTLTIRQGLTSDRPILDIYQGNDESFKQTNFVAPLTSGFYVRFDGVFDPDSRLAIAYAAFSYMSKLKIKQICHGSERNINSIHRLLYWPGIPV